MQASIVDLRYKMHDVLKALDRNERVALKILSCLSWDEQTRIASILSETKFF